MTTKTKKEPAAIRELRQIREKMLVDEKRVGSEKYWGDANREAREFAKQHGLQYVQSLSSGAYVLNDKPEKK